MPHLVNALVSVLAVSVLFSAFSMRKRIALVLALMGTTLVNFVAWIVVPGAWTHLTTPWACSALGAIAAAFAWALIRAYGTPFEPRTNTAAIAVDDPEDTWTI